MYPAHSVCRLPKMDGICTLVRQNLRGDFVPRRRMGNHSGRRPSRSSSEGRSPGISVAPRVIFCCVLWSSAQRAKSSPEFTNGTCGIEDEPLARWAGRYREQKWSFVWPRYQGFALRWVNRHPFGARRRHERGTESGTICHAMICQMGVPVRQGKTYRVAFWARGEDIRGETVSVAFSDTSAWSNCALQGMFLPGPEWSRHELAFRANHDCTATRLNTPRISLREMKGHLAEQDVQCEGPRRGAAADRHELLVEICSGPAIPLEELKANEALTVPAAWRKKLAADCTASSSLFPAGEEE